jgi:hypothetical protein
MALTIQLKRGLKANLPASALQRESLYTTTDTKELNVGTGAAVSPVKVDYANLLNVPASTVPAPTTYHARRRQVEGSRSFQLLNPSWHGRSYRGGATGL